MNLINEQLASVRRQKAVLKKKMETTDNGGEKILLAEQICKLTNEENRLLNELKIMV